MSYIEIVISALIGIIALIVSIYVFYFSFDSFRKAKEQDIDNSFDDDRKKEDRKKAKITTAVIIPLLFLLVLTSSLKIAMFCSKGSIEKQDSYIVEVQSSKMSEKNTDNLYLSDAPEVYLYQFDIAFFDKKEKGDIKLYDVVLYKENNQYMISRIIRINTDNYILRKDAETSDLTISKDQIIGVFAERNGFLSLINYLDSQPGIYIIITALFLNYLVFLFFFFKKQRL